MSGFPSTPPDDWHPVPILEPGDPLPADDQDRHLFGPVADGCIGLAGLVLVAITALYLTAHVVGLIVTLIV